MLVLQIVIKQWDKSQRTAAHVLERANLPDRYPITFPPACYEFNKQCVIDQHGDNTQGGRLKYAQLADGKIKFAPFQVSLEDKVIAYLGATQPDKAPNIIGSLNNQWVQCRYADRYSIFEGGFYYWIDKFNDNVFMDTEPALVFEDFQ